MSPRRGFLFVFLLVGSAMALRFWSPFPILQQAARVVTNPIHLATRSAVEGISSFAVSVSTLWKAQKENATYRAEINLLKSRIVFLEGVERENQSLHRILGFQSHPFIRRRLVGAEILARHPDTWFSLLEINRGERGGVRSGMLVLTPEGVVGIVKQTLPWSSSVQLVTDSQIVIPAMCERTREIGLITGLNGKDLELQYLPADAEIRAGDVVVTSGASERFPEGLRLGTVMDVQVGADRFFKKVLVRPAVNLAALHSVFLTTPE